MSEQHDPKVALVVGAGDATGGAVARRFAREGLVTCVTRRNAKIYWNLHRQPRSTWTFEMDLRPWAEPW